MNDCSQRPHRRMLVVLDLQNHEQKKLGPESCWVRLLEEVSVCEIVIRWTDRKSLICLLPSFHCSFLLMNVLNNTKQFYGFHLQHSRQSVQRQTVETSHQSVFVCMFSVYLCILSFFVHMLQTHQGKESLQRSSCSLGTFPESLTPQSQVKSQVLDWDFNRLIPELLMCVLGMSMKN